jgi:multidrug resistance protein EbrB
MMKSYVSYIALSISIISEVFATAMLKLAEGFTVLLPSIAVIAGYALSFYCLSLCLRTLPLSIAYAIWAGAGTALTAVIGVLAWGEAFHAFTAAGVILIIGGVVLLNLSGHPKPEKESAKQ